MLKAVPTFLKSKNRESDTKVILLEEVIEARVLQLIMDDFYKLTGLGIGILNRQGKVLVATGWQDICVKFHRMHFETCKNCVESDVELTTGLAKGEVRQYRCKNNMWDIMTPIYVGEIHVGNICHGQFFFEDDVIDYDFYRAQAKRYGFNEQEYLQALAKVPIRKRETVSTLMKFYTNLAQLVSETGVNNIELSNLLRERDVLLEALRGNEEKLISTNQEISLAYQQLEASEEELRAQYSEIQKYTSQIELSNLKYEYLANHDYLTDLPNRRKLIEKLKDEISHKRSGAVILLDLDDFKDINDILGHLYGDKVLVKVAQRLLQMKTEKVFIARIGGDEFVVVLLGEENLAVVEKYAEELLEVFKDGIDIDGNVVHINCSMGINVYLADNTDINQLLMNVDMALYEVKRTGKNNYMFFHTRMIEALKEKNKIEKLLRAALKEDGFKVLYQPQVCTDSGNVVGFEALLRLENNSISPSLFIPVAEETGLIIEIGRWVTNAVVNQLAQWKKEGLIVPVVSINFSVKQLKDALYLDFLKKLLHEKQIDIKHIEIEVTESVFLEEKEEHIKFLNEFKEAGIKIVLDDFGTGYSSLSTLALLPVSKVKLDKSLSDKFLELDNIKVMEGIISLAHNLNMQVVAEGVERKEQYSRLKAGKCNYIQGFLFSKPIQPAEAEKILQTKFF
ncbi:EAL domain-containing protein [Anaeroarcus burkinensis]|uniref:EAL domain-containing protein n=1 Tax=Anaeroarcus burkinensis TaxID=82376 RepID=UPI0003FEB9E4|nr:EAL domain-containing protein [Anaeroarcus burkinensis]